MIVLSTFLLSLSSDKIESPVQFRTQGFQTILDQSKSEKKLIFIYAKADWCKPCGKIKEKVFSKGKIGKYLNNNFINFELDIDDPKMSQLIRHYRIDQIPAYIFINEKGQVVLKSVGSKNASEMKKLAKDALKRK